MNFFQGPLSTVASAFPTSVVHAMPSTVAHAVPSSCDGDGPNDLACCNGCRCAVLFTILFGGAVLAVVAMQTPKVRTTATMAMRNSCTLTDNLPSLPSPKKSCSVGVGACTHSCPKIYVDVGTQKSPYIVFSNASAKANRKARSDNTITTATDGTRHNSCIRTMPVSVSTAEQPKIHHQQVQEHPAQTLGSYKGPSGDDYANVLELSSENVPQTTDSVAEETGEFVPDRVIVLPPCTCTTINVQHPSRPPCTCQGVAQQQTQPGQQPKPPDRVEKETNAKCRKRKSRRRRKPASQTVSTGVPADRRRSESRSQTRANNQNHRPRQCSEEPQRACPPRRSRPRGKRKSRH